MIYWDSSVILKLYVCEKDSEDWQDRALRSGKPLQSSALLLSEMAFALRAKERRAEIVAGTARKLYRLFRDDAAAGRFEIFPLGSDVVEKAASLAFSRRIKTGEAVRTLDGLHLATAHLLRCGKVATADARMQAAAKAFSFELI